MRAGVEFLTAGVALFVLIILLAAPAHAGEAKDPKALFVSLKCNGCHAVAKQAIAVVEEEGEEAEDDSDEAAPEPPDLSGVGLEHEASWIKDWLLKKVDVDGKKHRKKFEGKPGELDVLANWLASLKDPIK